MIKNTDAKVSFFNLNKINSFIKAHKDPLPDYKRKNVVYKIKCKNCNASYVGQTKRQLDTRIKEHHRLSKKDSNNPSVFREHITKFNHNFDWKNLRILVNEGFLSKRLISEMSHIYLQKNGINLQTDTEFSTMHILQY